MPVSRPFMRDRLYALLETADLAIASSAGVLGDEELEPLIESVRAARTRLAYPEDVMVVALAGGTGSGKSSLFNAVTGSDLVESGGVRPTTSHPAAAVPRDVGERMNGYLDRIGITERHSYDRPGLCLVDLPDTDSVETSHRLEVDRLLPVVDVVVWVTDPEKYRDARLHHDYLRPLAPYAPQFVFVLNQMDRLSTEGVAEVSADLERALGEDGIVDPTIVLTSASPRSGPPTGIEELMSALDARRSDPSVLFGRLLTDIGGVAAEIGGAVGPSVDFDERASTVVEDAVGRLVDRDSEGAAGAIVEFLDAVAIETGGETSKEVARMAGDVPRHIERIAAQLEPEAGRRRFAIRRLAPGIEPDRATSLVGPAIIRPVRAVLAKRALAQAAVVELALAVEALQPGPPR